MKRLVLLFLCLAGALAPGLVVGGELTRGLSAAGLLTPPAEDEEHAIGRRIAWNLLGAAPPVRDVRLQQYVNRVGRWVASQSERPALAWHFAVIDTDAVNAFAAPGGYVFVTRGLYRQLRSEAELAGVLAHEIAHVVRQHHLRLLQQSRLIELGGRLLASKAGDDARVQRLIGSGAEILARALDRDAEFEADRLAVVFAARAGYDPYGLPAVLQDLARVSRDDDRVALLFKTHPHPDDRLAMLARAMGDRLDGLRGKRLEKRLLPLR